MQFSAKNTLFSPVSACDVPAPFSSSNTSFDQCNSTLSSPVAPSESSKISTAAAKVVITTNGVQKVTLERESDLIEQLLLRWCSASRMRIEGWCWRSNLCTFVGSLLGTTPRRGFFLNAPSIRLGLWSVLKLGLIAMTKLLKAASRWLTDFGHAVSRCVKGVVVV